MSNKERLGKNPLFRDALEKKEQKTESIGADSKQSKLVKSSKSDKQPPAAVMAAIEEISADSKHSKPSESDLYSNSSKSGKYTSSAGLKEGWTRGAFVMREETLETIRNYAYWERLDIKDVVEEAFASFFKGRDVQPRPGKR